MTRRMYLVAVLTVSTVAMRAGGAVNLELRPNVLQVPIGEIVDVGLYAVSGGPTGVDFSGLDVVLTLDPIYLEWLDALDDGPHAWSFLFGFLSDSALDGLNETFLDGDAFFQAASFTSATATPDGVLVASLRFLARAGAPDTQFVIQSERGDSTRTQVLAPGGMDVTGKLSAAVIALLGSIPAVSEWGLLSVVLLVSAAGTIVIDRRRVEGVATWG